MKKIKNWVLYGAVTGAALNVVYTLGLGSGYYNQIFGRLAGGAFGGALVGLTLGFVFLLCINILRSRAYGVMPIDK